MHRLKDKHFGGFSLHTRTQDKIDKITMTSAYRMDSDLKRRLYPPEEQPEPQEQ
jgi:hypothetical protein